MGKVEEVIDRLELLKQRLILQADILGYGEHISDIDNALELLKAKDINVPTKWVSVKDRLPENDRFVLVCNDDGHMLVAQYIEETVQWQYKYTNYDVDVWDDEEQGPVCWWAELPEPPKEGDGE